MDWNEYEDGPVSGDDLIAEIINYYPEAADLLAELGMHCIGCASLSFETLSEACRVHHLNPTKVKMELNRIITGRK